MATTTLTRINNWFSTAVGRKMNPDHAYGLQCKDAIDDYAQSIYGVSWVTAIRPGNANKVFANAPTAYWQKIANNASNSKLIPKKGDIICYPGRASNMWLGHVAVVESADEKGVHVIQQDGFLQKPAFRAYIAYASYLPQGWLRPHLPAPAPKPNAVYYTVRTGDTMSTIAAKYKTTLTNLKNLNPGIKNVNLIYAGQKVRVK